MTDHEVRIVRLVGIVAYGVALIVTCVLVLVEAFR